MSRKSSAVAGGDTGTVEQYNFLRDEAVGASWLLAYGTSTLKVLVNESVVYFREGKVEFAGGLSPVLSAPAASSRIDAVSMNASGTIVVTAGTEADSPTAPDVPANNMPVCEVYNRAGQVKINDTDTDAGEGYIYKDLRSFLYYEKNISLTEKGIGEEATAAEINVGTQIGGTSAELLVNPKYLKDSQYYTFRPTTDEKDALAGTGTPNSTNKYVTNDDTSAATTADKVVRYTAGGDVNVPATPGADQDAASKGYVDTLDGANVKLTGNQTVNGIKTFGSIPVFPGSNPTTDNQGARKRYADIQQEMFVPALKVDYSIDGMVTDLTYITMNDGADTHAYGSFFMPSKGSISSIQLVLLSGNTTDNFVFDYAFNSITNGSSESDSSTGNVVADSQPINIPIIVTIPSAAYDGLTRGRLWSFDIMRDGDHGSDNATTVVGCVGIIVNFS